MPECLTFDGTEDFEALNKAEAFLRAAGFSYGRLQRGSPIGILYGNYDIQKWRNMDDEEIAALHGLMTTRDGSFRRGLVFVEIRDSAPLEAREAFAKASSDPNRPPDH